MKGCLTWLFGLIVGVVLIMAAQVLLIKPPPIGPVPPSSSDVVVLYKNAYLTRQLRAQASRAELPTPISELTVRAEPADQLIVDGSASATILGRSIAVPLRVTARPVIENDQVAFQITQAQIGGMPLPTAMAQGIQHLINQQARQMLAGSSLRAVGVETTVEGMVVEMAQVR